MGLIGLNQDVGRAASLCERPRATLNSLPFQYLKAAHIVGFGPLPLSPVPAKVGPLGLIPPHSYLFCCFSLPFIRTQLDNLSSLRLAD